MAFFFVVFTSFLPRIVRLSRHFFRFFSWGSVAFFFVVFTLFLVPRIVRLCRHFFHIFSSSWGNVTFFTTFFVISPFLVPKQSTRKSAFLSPFFSYLQLGKRGLDFSKKRSRTCASPFYVLFVDRIRSSVFDAFISGHHLLLFYVCFERFCG